MGLRAAFGVAVRLPAKADGQGRHWLEAIEAVADAAEGPSLHPFRAM